MVQYLYLINQFFSDLYLHSKLYFQHQKSILHLQGQHSPVSYTHLRAHETRGNLVCRLLLEKKSVSRWGIYNLSKKVSKNNFLIKEVVEKPSIKNAPSNKAVIGRYILPKTIFKKLLHQEPGKGGEIHITDAIQSLINENEKFIAHNFAGKYLDCGTMSGFIKSNIEIGKL